MSWSNDGEKVNIKWTGTFRLSEDEKDISWIEDGGHLSISDGIVFKSSIELRGVNGKVERTFWKNGFRRDYEPEGRVFLAAALDKLIRHSGVFARDRVARFLKQGGPDAVLAEITRLSDSSYVRRIYYTELAKQAELSEPLVTRILQRVPSELGSDYDKATLLIALAKLPAITEAHRVLVARAAGSISSDYDQRRTLAAIMAVQPLPAALAAAVLEATASITSSYDRSLVLKDVAGRGGLTPATSAAFMNLVNSMSSSYDKRRVLSAVSAGGARSDAVTIDVIKSAGGISSSHDQSETLLGLLDRTGLSDGSADAFFAAASKISSSHDLSRVLRRVVDQSTASERILEGVLRTAARISSSHDRANLLEAVATRAKVTGPSRELYISATRGMGPHDENRVLAALVRAEGRR
jgi:hypothetical protein